MRRMRRGSDSSSCESVRSDWSMDPPNFFHEEDSSTEPRMKQKRTWSVVTREQSVHFRHLNTELKELKSKFIPVMRNELSRFKRLLNVDSFTLFGGRTMLIMSTAA